MGCILSCFRLVQNRQEITDTPDEHSRRSDHGFHNDDLITSDNATPSVPTWAEHPAESDQEECDSPEDENFCPTCLEEYTRDNPKILTQCCHGYHLGCILDWMERSPNCPYCYEVTLIDDLIES